MKLSISLRIAAAGIIVCGCGELPQEVTRGDVGTLHVNVWISKPGERVKARRAMETNWRKLILQVSGEDMDTMRDTSQTSMTESYHQIELAGIPAGKNRIVQGWTEDTDGARVHGGSATVAELEPDQIETVALALDAYLGSIYIVLGDVPPTIDSVFACFAFDNDTLWDRQERSGLLEMCIDKVPDGASGNLIITAVDAFGDTLHEDFKTFAFNAGINQSLEAEFSANNHTASGELTAQVYLSRPGVTVVSGLVGTETPVGPELGPLIISEIMYYAVGDSDYVEFYNPTDSTLFFDTLMLEVVGTSSSPMRYFYNVSIAPNGYFVIGDSDAPRGDGAWNLDTTAVLDLTTTRRWLILKSRQADGSVGTIDWLAYSGSDDQGWPSKSRLYSIELDSLPDDPAYNNYGRNWISATTEIGSSEHFGTPGH
ncbi:MAG: hypothetical protein GF344_11005 [Chitinivibrionales bacterium]|nr:hypothetical protein [Chitinivibrionales bacterium]MBD3357332.1 hypothetical protein [Chitinivibrionales bacterium]